MEFWEEYEPQMQQKIDQPKAISGGGAASPTKSALSKGLTMKPGVNIPSLHNSVEGPAPSR